MKTFIVFSVITILMLASLPACGEARKEGTKEWSFTTGSCIYSSPAIGPDSTIYIGSFDNKLYAVYCSSKGLAKNPCPKFLQNNQNCGRK